MKQMSKCEGEVVPKTGCKEYAGSQRHSYDIQHEEGMRRNGLGFATQLDPAVAMMLGHLQGQHGMGYAESLKVVEGAE